MKKIIFSNGIIILLVCLLISVTSAVAAEGPEQTDPTVLHLTLNKSSLLPFNSTNLAPGNHTSWQWVEVTNNSNKTAVFYFYVGNLIGTSNATLADYLDIELRTPGSGAKPDSCNSPDSSLIYKGTITSLSGISHRIVTGNVVASQGSQTTCELVTFDPAAGNYLQATSVTFDQFFRAEADIASGSVLGATDDETNSTSTNRSHGKILGVSISIGTGVALSSVLKLLLFVISFYLVVFEIRRLSAKFFRHR
jgi:hypothetical protein